MSKPALEPEPAALPDGTHLLELDPSAIEPNPKQPRSYFDEEAQKAKGWLLAQLAKRRHISMAM